MNILEKNINITPLIINKVISLLLEDNYILSFVTNNSNDIDREQLKIMINSKLENISFEKAENDMISIIYVEKLSDKCKNDIKKLNSESISQKEKITYIIENYFLPYQDLIFYIVNDEKFSDDINQICNNYDNIIYSTLFNF